MDPLHTVDEILQAIERAKAGATDFRTNLFSDPAKLQAWLGHDRLPAIVRDGVTFFFRKDRDFWHLYFCAANLPALRREVTALSEWTSKLVVADLVGNESAIADLALALQFAGFKPYARLHRMARGAWPEQPRSARSEIEVVYAEKADSQAILDLIESEFDIYAEQPPMLCELVSAIEQSQVLTVKLDRKIGGGLFCETRGLASTVRFWVVHKSCRALRMGSALMLRYFATHQDVRRFTLWVNGENENAIRKYQHYGYAYDGLVDQVLTNQTHFRMSSVREILKEIRPEFDFASSNDFLRDGMLDSFDIATLVAKLDQTYRISIKGTDIVPENFQNVRTIEALLRKSGAQL